MTNFKILFKNNFNILIGTLSGKRKRKSVVASLLLVLGVVGIFVLYFLQALSMFNGLGKMHLEKVCLFHSILVTLTVLVVLGIMRSAVSSRQSDSDFLLSLPIKKSEIILSKILNKYLYDFAFTFLLFVPFLVLFQVFVGFSAWVLLRGISFLFLAPLVSVSISCFCDFIVSRLFNRLRIGDFLKSFFIVFIFVVVMILMLFKTFSYGFADLMNLDKFFSDRPISNLVLNFILFPRVSNVLTVVLVPILMFVLAMFCFALDFGKIFPSYVSHKKELKFSSEKQTLSLLLKKEFYSFATTPAYIINTIVGPIMILALGIFLCTSDLSWLSSFLGLGQDKNLMAFVVAIVFSGICATAPISASSISLEGKNFWILKTSPISEEQVILAKTLTHFLVCEPAILLSSVIVSVCFQFGLVQSLTLILLPTFLNAILSVLGCLLNLIYPKFEFENPTKIVKQSLPVLLCIVFGILLTLVPFGFFKIFKSISFVQLFAISLSFYVLIFIISVSLLFTKGIALFRNLQE